MWKAQQKALYPNTFDVFPSQTLEQVLYNEEYENLANYNTQRIIAKNNLIKIIDSTTAEYILDRLEIDKIIYINQGFKKIVEDIKTRGKFNKDIFIQYLNEQKEDPLSNAVDNLPNNRPNTTASARAFSNQENDKLKEQANEYEAEMKRQQDESDKDGINYTNKLNAQQRARLIAQKNQEISRFSRLTDAQKRIELDLIFPNIDDVFYALFTKKEILDGYARYVRNGKIPAYTQPPPQQPTPQPPTPQPQPPTPQPPGQAKLYTNPQFVALSINDKELYFKNLFGPNSIDGSIFGVLKPAEVDKEYEELIFKRP